MRRIDELSEHLTKRQETYKTQSGVRNTITKIDLNNNKLWFRMQGKAVPSWTLKTIQFHRCDFKINLALVKFEICSKY